MSKGSKRLGRRAQDRIYNSISRDLQSKASQAGMKQLQEVIKILTAELVQMHTRKYSECKDGCPACHAIDLGLTAIVKRSDLVIDPQDPLTAGCTLQDLIDARMAQKTVPA